MRTPMRIGGVGAGISGLSVALRLASRGHHVEIFQREAGVGGLIATLDFQGCQTEHFDHFLYAGDVGYFALSRELGSADGDFRDRISAAWVWHREVAGLGRGAFRIVKHRRFLALPLGPRPFVRLVDRLLAGSGLSQHALFEKR